MFLMAGTKVQYLRCIWYNSYIAFCWFQSIDHFILYFFHPIHRRDRHSYVKLSTRQFTFRCQYYVFRYPWVPALQGVITFFVLANFTLATFMDPGVIPKGSTINILSKTAITNEIHSLMDFFRLQLHQMKTGRMISEHRCTKASKSTESPYAWSGASLANFTDHRDVHTAVFATTALRYVIERVP